MKGPEEGAQARDSRHQDGTSRLRRPGALDSPARSHAAVADPRPPVVPHLLETFGPGGGTYFSTSRDCQTISLGFESLRVILAVLEGETRLLLE
ncbi:hypothetical protein R6Z07F_018516 [Ovis aries]